MKGRKNKYNAQKAYFNGQKYDSKLEAQVAEYLELLKKQKKIKTVERQYKINIEAQGEKLYSMRIDFFIVNKYGQKYLIEVKGVETALFRLKYKIFKKLWLAYNKEYEYLIITKNNMGQLALI